MTLNEYQEKVVLNAPCDNFSEAMMSLVAEVGELAGMVASDIHHHRLSIRENQIEYDGEYVQYSESTKSERVMTTLIMRKIGDVMQQLASISNAIGWSLDDAAECNIYKLYTQQQQS